MKEIPVAEDGWVVMRHPNIPDQYAKARRQAYDLTWEPKGWVEVTDKDRAEQLPRKKSELIGLAQQAGVDPSGTADEIRERLLAQK